MYHYSYRIWNIGPSARMNPRTNVDFGNVPIELFPNFQPLLEKHIKRIQAVDIRVDRELLNFELVLLRYIPQPLDVFKICRNRSNRLRGKAEAVFVRFHLAWKRVRRAEVRLSKAGVRYVPADPKKLAAQHARINKLGATIEIARIMRENEDSETDEWTGSGANEVLRYLEHASMKPCELGLTMKDLQEKAKKERERWESKSR